MNSINKLIRVYKTQFKIYLIETSNKEFDILVVRKMTLFYLNHILAMDDVYLI